MNGRLTSRVGELSIRGVWGLTNHNCSDETHAYIPRTFYPTTQGQNNFAPGLADLNKRSPETKSLRPWLAIINASTPGKKSLWPWLAIINAKQINANKRNRLQKKPAV